MFAARFNRRRSFALAAVLAVVCVFAAAPSWAQRPAREYVDAETLLRSDADYDAWYGGVHKLRDGFDQICGDTFCEGDYSNIYGLRFRCSVERNSGVLKQCLWVFAASNEEVDAASGRIAVTPKVWRCRIALAPGTGLQALLTTMAGERPLYAPLPGSAKSIYDSLIDCL
ncbi:hypothetical protein [Pseudomonas sp. CGJS7]|uniref:hypothetical protein n=1 Tax=Pseudomonas sp. CGJS7 TaxID=3109348 RepID=UPI0030082F56